MTLVVVMFMTGAIACSPTSAPVSAPPTAVSAQPADAPEQPYKGTAITVALTSHPATEAIKPLVSEFEEATGIKVTIDEMDAVRRREKNLLELSQPTGSLDVVIVYAPWKAEFVGKGLLEPLNHFIEDPKYTPSSYDYNDFLEGYRTVLGSTGDVIDGIPFSAETAVLAYRTDLFEKYGKTPPETWDEVLELAQFFNGKEPGLYGITLRGAKGWPANHAFLLVGLGYDVEVIDRDLNVHVNNDKGEAALNMYLALAKTAPPGIANFNYDEMVTAFMQGTTAMYYDASNCAQITNPKVSTVYDKVAFTIPPKQTTRGSAVAGLTLSIAKNSQNKEAAWEFLKFVSSKEGEKKACLNGKMPNRVSVFQDPELVAKYPFYPTVLETLTYISPKYKPYWLPQYTPVDDLLGTEVSSALIGEKTAKQALDTAAVGIEKIVKP